MRTPVFGIFSLLASLTVIAAVSSSASAAPPSGRLLASQCSQCHGTNGHAISGFPQLAGRSASATYKKLILMKYRITPTSIMDLQARNYTDMQLQLIANYYATQ
jgi:cytochrome subunit of sulfide dehydrogenase